MSQELLSNLKILDFTTLLPGPYATLMLADMGAEVLKVSAPGKGDLVLESEPKSNISGLSANLLWMNRNKKTLTLNLKEDEAREIVKKLVVEYDIVVEQFRPGVMERLGLSYEELRKINPRIIYCSITGYGQNGVMSHKAGHDINYLARSGIMSHSCREKEGPVLMGTQIADIAVGSMNAIVGILAAVNYRNYSGLGQSIDISMMDGLIPMNSFVGSSFLFTGEEFGREKDLLNGGSLYDFYKTANGRYLSVGSLEPKFWKEFCVKIGREDLIKGSVCPKNVSEVKEEIRTIIEAKSLEEWMEIFKDSDCCVEPVLSLEEAFNRDKHIEHRGLIVELENENEKARQYAFPIKFSESEIVYRHMGKSLGSDNEEVLKSLGYSSEAIKTLEDKKII